MATDQFGPNFVICSPSGKTEQPLDSPLERIAGKCCSALCEAASTVGPLIEPTRWAVDLVFPLVLSAKLFQLGMQQAPPREPGVIPEPRGPPSLSL
ncbi:hypothetical protein [Tianweitania sediminis]|uniref:hypothetical protein n=1 Tax=Tianweitania sediminis TaxID=1502156 RepID=UPI0036DC7430